MGTGLMPRPFPHNSKNTIMDYKEQIKSPLWQKRRLEILSRDNFTCQICGCKDKTLHVHHLVYEKGKMIWEYPNHQLITLCEECHEYEHYYSGTVYEIIGNLRMHGISNKEIHDLLHHVFCQIAKGNQRIIQEIVGKNFDPEADIPYIELLAQRREDCLNNQEK